MQLISTTPVSNKYSVWAWTLVFNVFFGFLLIIVTPADRSIIVWIWIVLGVIGFLIVTWLKRSAVEVWDVGDALIVAKSGHKERIPFTNIMNWANERSRGGGVIGITLTLHTPCRFGSKIAFMPITVATLADRWPDPEIYDGLISRIHDAQARAGALAAKPLGTGMTPVEKYFTVALAFVMCGLVWWAWVSAVVFGNSIRSGIFDVLFISMTAMVLTAAVPTVLMKINRLADSVWDAGDALVVYKSGARVRILLADINNLEYPKVIIRYSMALLTLREPCRFGQKITFLVSALQIPAYESLAARIHEARRQTLRDMDARRRQALHEDVQKDVQKLHI
jgi:hypothetical protein